MLYGIRWGVTYVWSIGFGSLSVVRGGGYGWVVGGSVFILALPARSVW